MSSPGPSDRGNGVPELSIVVPMFNEEENIDYFFQRIFNLLDSLNLTQEIICVNDGSSDGTLEKLLAYHQKYPQVKVLNFSRNFGKETALTAGLHYARGRAVVPIDADLQDPPELIQTFIAKWREGYDVVYAVRTKRHGEGWFKRATANLFYRLINFFSETAIPKNTGNFRLLDARVVKVLNQISENTRFLKGLFAWVGFKQIGVPYEREPRHGGKTKWNYWRLWNLALDAITLFSTVPLRLWGYVGLTISFLTLAYAAFLVIRTLIFGIVVPGYASIMVAILFLGGLQLFTLGIIGEYLGRVYAETKKRPLYVVAESYGFEKEPDR
jgi:glycosyltransferase involved in cell wall biosynthesis